MVLEMKNLESINLEIKFPEKEAGREQFLEQLLKINIENLRAFKTPFSTIISSLQDLPVVTIRSPNQSYRFNQDEFSMRISGSNLFPEPEMDKKEFEFNEDFLSSVQANYNLLMGMTIGNLKENIMNIEIYLLYEYDYKYNFNEIINKGFVSKLVELFKEGLIDIDGIRFSNIIESDDIKYKFRLWIDETDEKLKIRYGKICKKSIVELKIQNIIEEALISINNFLSIR